MDFKKLFSQYLALINRFVPQAVVPPVVGIDVGTHAIKAVEVETSAGKISIRRWAVEPVGANDSKSALKKIVERLHLSDQILVSSVSGKGSLIRYLDMPRMSLDDLRKSFVFDLDKYLPFEPQSIYTDCAILDPEGKDKKMFVLLAAVKKEMVEERLKLFQEVGLELDRLTLNSIATANAFKCLGPALATPVNAKAVLDIGSSISSLMIFKDSSMRFARDIFVGSQELTRQIANTLGVDDAQAETIKCHPADKLEQVIDACDTPINNLITEIRLSMDYFMTEKNVQVDELFLSGGGSLLKGMEGVFEKNLGVRVATWNPLLNAQLSASQVTDQLQNYAVQLSVALGLGCH